MGSECKALLLGWVEGEELFQLYTIFRQVPTSSHNLRKIVVLFTKRHILRSAF